MITSASSPLKGCEMPCLDLGSGTDFRDFARALSEQMDMINFLDSEKLGIGVAVQW